MEKNLWTTSKSEYDTTIIDRYEEVCRFDLRLVYLEEKLAVVG